MCKIFISRWPKKDIRKQRRPSINISNRKRMFRMKGFVFARQVNWQTKPSNSLLLDWDKKPKPATATETATVDEQIRDQVISKCLSHQLRRKLLQKGQNLTLPQLREIVRSMVESEKQTRSFEGGSGEVRSEVNSVSGKTNYKGDASAWKVKCFCCGYTIVVVQREGNSAGSVMDQDILRLCVNSREANEWSRSWRAA